MKNFFKATKSTLATIAMIATLAATASADILPNLHGTDKLSTTTINSQGFVAYDRTPHNVILTYHDLVNYYMTDEDIRAFEGGEKRIEYINSVHFLDDNRNIIQRVYYTFEELADPRMEVIEAYRDTETRLMNIEPTFYGEIFNAASQFKIATNAGFLRVKVTHVHTNWNGTIDIETRGLIAE